MLSNEFYGSSHTWRIYLRYIIFASGMDPDQVAPTELSDLGLPFLQKRDK